MTTQEITTVEAPALAPPTMQPKVDKTYPPDFAGINPPAQLWRARRIGNLEYIQRNKTVEKGVLHLPGRGSKSASVMFLSPCVLMEESWSAYDSKPMMLKGPAANLFMRSLRRARIEDESWFYTTLCKYNVPKLKPTSADIRWNAAMLEDEIATIKPKLIVCLGKVPFDYLFKIKFKLKQIQGGFFRSDRYDTVLYPMDSIMVPLQKPEYLDRFLTDLKEVRKFLDDLQGILRVNRVEKHYRIVSTMAQLHELVDELAALQAKKQLTHLAVDCEWLGQTAWGGRLRSIQLCWRPGHAAHVKFCDQTTNYVFDIPLREAAEIMRPVLEYPGTKFVGHNFAADAAWMEHHLKVKTYRRCAFDTMFAEQTLNEYSDLKLERLAVKYTDLGRYDIPLMMWKKKTRFDEDDDNDGYGRVPDKILEPYSLCDVDATLRIFPLLMQQLVKQGLWDYYFNIALPFTTDGYLELMRTGLPIDADYLEDMRETFTQNQGILLDQFRKDLKVEAWGLLEAALREINTDSLGASLDQIIGGIMSGPEDAAEKDRIVFEAIKAATGPEKFAGILPLLDHWRGADMFNVNSTADLKRWLFDVKKFPPLKTTKKDGVQIAWEKVLTYSPEKQSQFTPAADKQTIKLLANRDPLVAKVEDMKSVGNIIKAYLKGPDEEGREQGLQKWLQPDARIHPNYAITETARPRAWRPNVLNWPKYISKPIERAFSDCNARLAEEARARMVAENKTDSEISAVVSALQRKPVSLRSAVLAPEGYCLLDMDLKTAEVVALAYISGDTNMIGVVSEVDAQFARIDSKDPKKAVRIAYNKNEGIPESEWDPALLTPLDDLRILRSEDGVVLHPKRDLHFEMGCSVFGKPREKLDEDVARGVGKVTNFSTPYGASDSLLERMVEVNTGKKPEEGTGKKMLEAYATRYPVADRFLKSMELIPQQGGIYRSLSGRVRHFFFNRLEDVEGLSDYTRSGILSPLLRQARNFPMQELVAATTAKALRAFMAARNAQGKRSAVMVVLYDAMTVLTPLEELKWATQTLRECLTSGVVWTVHDRSFSFEVDVSVGFRWGVKMTAEEKEMVAPYL